MLQTKRTSKSTWKINFLPTMKENSLCVTFGSSIISNREAVLSETDINQCSSEEANPRIVRHVVNHGKKRRNHGQVKTVDSDVGILCL